MKYMLAVALLSCTSPQVAADAPPDIPSVVRLVDVPACASDPCVVQVLSTDEPAQIGYRLCCTFPQTRVVALAVDSTSGPWGDVTKWAFCGVAYIDEFTDSNRNGTTPWAVLNTYTNGGGDIAQCKTVNAP